MDSDCVFSGSEGGATAGRRGSQTQSMVAEAEWDKYPIYSEWKDQNGNWDLPALEK